MNVTIFSHVSPIQLYQRRLKDLLMVGLLHVNMNTNMNMQGPAELTLAWALSPTVLPSDLTLAWALTLDPYSPHVRPKPNLGPDPYRAVSQSEAAALLEHFLASRVLWR